MLEILFVSHELQNIPIDWNYEVMCGQKINYEIMWDQKINYEVICGQKINYEVM